MLQFGSTAFLDDSESTHSFPISCDNALEYTHAYAMPMGPGDPAIIQFGSTESTKVQVQHVRVYVCDPTGNRGYLGEEFVPQLWEWLNQNEKLTDEQIWLTRVEAAYLLMGLGLEDLRIDHSGEHAFAKETVATEGGQVCGYQFGRHLSTDKRSGPPARPYTRRARSALKWRQTREVALFERDEYGKLPTICISWKLAQPTTYSSLIQFNPLDGLSIRQRIGAGSESVEVESWNAERAWEGLLLSAGELQGCC